MPATTFDDNDKKLYSQDDLDAAVKAERDAVVEYIRQYAFNLSMGGSEANLSSVRLANVMLDIKSLKHHKKGG